MPMYRYVCSECGNEEVHLHSINEVPTISCSRCGRLMTRSISRVGILFKGSGFYITDSKKVSSSTSSESKGE
ncbi:MAG: FmdB family zinc ribbon protein [Fervidobacterium sp.]